MWNLRNVTDEHREAKKERGKPTIGKKLKVFGEEVGRKWLNV